MLWVLIIGASKTYHNIGFCGEIRKRRTFFWLKKKSTLSAVENSTLPGALYNEYQVPKLLCFQHLSESFVLLVLRFCGPIHQMGSFRAWSIYLTTLLLGMLSPLSS